MSTDTVRGRFSVTKGKKVKPIMIISYGNIYEPYSNTKVRDYFSVMDNCKDLSKDEFVTWKIAEKCLRREYPKLKEEADAGVLKGLPKSENGFVNGFRKKSITAEDFKQWEDSPRLFEKYQYRFLPPLSDDITADERSRSDSKKSKKRIVARIMPDSCCNGEIKYFMARPNKLDPSADRALMKFCDSDGKRVPILTEYPSSRYNLVETSCPPNVRRKKCFAITDSLTGRVSSKIKKYGALVKGKNGEFYHTGHLKGGSLMC